MNASLRAALVGAVVGLAQFVLLCLRGDNIGLLDLLMTVVLSSGLGFFLSWWGRLPRWWGVGLVGPAVIVAFLLADLPLVSATETMDSGDWQMGLSLMALGATAYLAAAGLFMSVHRALRVLMVAGVAVAYLAVWSAQDVLADATRAHRLARSGVPLVAPTLPSYRLWSVTGVDGRLELRYEREDGVWQVDVAVEPVGAVSPKGACKHAVPYDGLPEHAECRQVSPGAWLLPGDSQKILWAWYGDALVRVESLTMGEKELIAVLRSLHPVEARELARLHEDWTPSLSS
ncbi:hypothetical protein AB0H88_03970 [Nonomuraea sp. NPDC050680]|uniref:hypothetical protein n=1 Tax=Nonomuraea sp. NPDC050680 TaxID=3154630 RepID=UPI003411AAA0